MNRVARTKWGMYASNRFHHLGIAGAAFCVFFDFEEPYLVGAVIIDAARRSLHEAKVTDRLQNAAIWQDLGHTVGFETAGHRGPLTIHDGAGRPIAVGQLPDGMFLVWQYTPAIWQENGRWRAAVRTVDSLELAAYGDEPPCTISVLELPTAPTDTCTVVRQFPPSPLEDLELPEVEFGWMEHVQRGVSVCPTPLGTRLAMSEMVRLVTTKGEMLDFVRLWLCDLDGGRTLAATSATHLSADYRTGRILSLAPDGTVTEEPTARASDAQVSPWDMLSAFSPDGRQMAYVNHGILYIADLESIGP